MCHMGVGSDWDSLSMSPSHMSLWVHCITSLSLRFLTCHMGIRTAPDLFGVWELSVRLQALGGRGPLCLVHQCSPAP